MMVTPSAMGALFFPSNFCCSRHKAVLKERLMMMRVGKCYWNFNFNRTYIVFVYTLWLFVGFVVVFRACLFCLCFYRGFFVTWFSFPPFAFPNIVKFWLLTRHLSHKENCSYKVPKCFIWYATILKVMINQIITTCLFLSDPHLNVSADVLCEETKVIPGKKGETSENISFTSSKFYFSVGAFQLFCMEIMYFLIAWVSMKKRS